VARREPPEECSQCGEAIPRNAVCCPGCGADERTGWDENPYLETDRDIPDFLIEDRDDARDPPIFDRQVWTRRGWWVVAVVVTALFVYLTLGGRF
jgi:hypothetical protein